MSSSLAVCSFSTFWLTVFGKRRSLMVLHYCLLALCCLTQVNTISNTKHSNLYRSIRVNIFKVSDIMVNDYTISDS